jgi:hypothetical protein
MTIGVKFFLIGQISAAAINQPDQRNIQTFGKVGHQKNIFRLSRKLCPCHHFIVKTDNYGTLPGNFSDIVNDIRGALHIAHRIVKRMQGAPGTGIDKVFKALPNRFKKIGFCKMIADSI